MPTEPGPKSRLRDELISRAKLGEITPEDAESEAMLVDCGPLELRPESLDLDPQTEDQWTLLMALVWIIERDLTAVRAVWNRARRDATEWVDSPLVESDGTGAEHKKSWELKPLDPPTVGDVDAVVDEEAEFMLPPFIVPGHAAREDLWANLRSGRLPAQGKRRGTSERIDILMSDWTDLDWLADLTASADTVGDRMENAPKYDDVSVSGQRVREIWPPLEDVQSGEYDRDDWSVDHAILWIAYRKPALFHFVGLRNPRAQARFSAARRQDPAPKKTLLNALMTDKLRAFRNGRELPPEYWFGKSLPGRQPKATRIYFRQSDVRWEWQAPAEDLEHRIGGLLKQLWLKLGKRPSQQAAYDFLKTRDDCKGVTSSLVRQWMNKNWGPGKQGKRRLDPESRPPETL